MPNNPPPPARKDKPSISVVKAAFSYTAQRDDELTFHEGDLLYILDKTTEEGGWIRCRRGDEEGLVPGNYLSSEQVEIVDNPLHEAAKRGNLELAQEMLTIGISVNGLDSAGNTPLHCACRSKAVALVKLLLSHKPVINAQNKMGDTPLHSAAWGGSPEVVKLLLEQDGIRKDIQNNDGLTAIELARNDDAAALIMTATTISTSQNDLFSGTKDGSEYDPESD